MSGSKGSEAPQAQSLWKPKLFFMKLRNISIYIVILFLYTNLLSFVFFGALAFDTFCIVFNPRKKWKTRTDHSSCAKIQV